MAVARILVSRSTFVFDIRATQFSRERARHRNLSPCGLGQALSRGISGTYFAEHSGRCQSCTRLENLCRFRPSVDLARILYDGDQLGVALKQEAYAIDSTTIVLCLSQFPWADFRRNKGAVKIHTLLRLRGTTHCVIRIIHETTHDVTVLAHPPIKTDAFYLMNRGYIVF